MPTEENPLLRFYPSSDDEDDESNEIPDQIMMSDQSLNNKHSQRSPKGPVKEFYAESASAGSRHQLTMSAVVASFPAIFLILMEGTVSVRHLLGLH